MTASRLRLLSNCVLPACVRWRTDKACCVASTAHVPVPFFTFLESALSFITIVLIVLLLMLVGALPTWPHSKGWGYAPSGGLGVVVVVLIVLLLMGRV
jgi:hypothetical protein